MEVQRNMSRLVGPSAETDLVGKGTSKRLKDINSFSVCISPTGLVLTFPL